MPKVLVSVRLNECDVNWLKSLATESGKTQSEILIEGLALVQTISSYRKKFALQENSGMSSVESKKSGGFCE